MEFKAKNLLSKDLEDTYVDIHLDNTALTGKEKYEQARKYWGLFHTPGYSDLDRRVHFNLAILFLRASLEFMGLYSMSGTTLGESSNNLKHKDQKPAGFIYGVDISFKTGDMEEFSPSIRKLSRDVYNDLQNHFQEAQKLYENM